ncbi:hypothetical protein MICABA_01661 [Microbacterium sp. T2.11-28]|nr:hypothetical protein MICABA_01661 [Microbacterium sp. T2.11-28]
MHTLIDALVRRLRTPRPSRARRSTFVAQRDRLLARALR